MTKRKSQTKTEPEPPPQIVAPQDVTVAREMPRIAQERAAGTVPCIVCGSETRADLSEQLCWVCRRLKISAWRDTEQMPAQE